MNQRGPAGARSSISVDQPAKRVDHTLRVYKMPRSKNDELKLDLLAGMGQPALQALNAAGYTRLDQLTTIKAADLLKLHGVGPKALGVIRKALDARGLSFADPD